MKKIPLPAPDIAEMEGGISYDDFFLSHSQRMSVWGERGEKVIKKEVENNARIGTGSQPQSFQ